MPRVTTIIIIFILLLPPLLESDLFWEIVIALNIMLPFIGAAYDIYLLRRILEEKRKIANIMKEIPLELRAFARRSDGEFNRALTTIQDLHTKMQDSQEALTKEALTQRL